MPPLLRGLTKHVLDAHTRCPRLAWHARRGLVPRTSSAMRDMLAAQGHAFEARVLGAAFPDAADASGPLRVPEAAAATAVHMRARRPVLQPTFRAGALVARADAAVPSAAGGGWDIVEVKSCAATNYRKRIPDVAFTFDAARRAGVDARGAYLYVVSPDFRRGDPHGSLHMAIDVSEDVRDFLDRAHAAEDRYAAAAASTAAAAAPPPRPQPRCKGCDMFATCVGAGLKHSIWELPRLSGKRFDDVAAAGLEIADVCAAGEGGAPPEGMLTKAQLGHALAVRRGAPAVVAPGTLRTLLEGLKEPYRYLDFEAVSALEPLYRDVAPFESIATQFSVHSAADRAALLAATGPDGAGGLSHGEFLAPFGDADPRRPLAEALLSVLGDDNGAIFAYSSYEKTTLNRLGAALPDLQPALARAASRIVDLEAIVKKHVSHPGFRGQSSIKVTLPALVPGFAESYDKLQGIKDGAHAAMAFDECARDPDSASASQVREQLLRYCALDSLAMAEMHAALLGMLERGNEGLIDRDGDARAEPPGE